MMLGNYSKLVGSVVGGVFGLLVANFGLPAEWATPEIQGAVTVIMSAAFTYLFPANNA
jgi:hypothetical protein